MIEFGSSIEEPPATNAYHPIPGSGSLEIARRGARKMVHLRLTIRSVVVQCLQHSSTTRSTPGVETSTALYVFFIYVCACLSIFPLGDKFPLLDSPLDGGSTTFNYLRQPHSEPGLARSG
jgi:hypothetical protein